MWPRSHYKAIIEGFPSRWVAYLQGRTDERSLMSLRLTVPQEYNGTLVVLPKADKGQGDLQSLQGFWESVCMHKDQYAGHSLNSLPACNCNSGTHLPHGERDLGMYYWHQRVISVPCLWVKAWAMKTYLDLCDESCCCFGLPRVQSGRWE